MGFRQPISIFWFRRDLRLQDNTAMKMALQGEYPVLPIFIFDKNILGKLENQQDPRITFIHNTLASLKSELENYESTLKTYYGTPEEVFYTLFELYNIKAVYVNRDYEPVAQSRDQKIESIIQKGGAHFFSFKDHVIFEANEILKADGSPFKVFTPFKKSWIDQYVKAHQNSKIQITDSSNFYKTDPSNLIELSTMGFGSNSNPLPSNKPDLNIIRNYHKNRDFPSRNGTTRLGIHLRFGTVSIREMIKLAYMENESWLNELIWREFYSYIMQHFPFVVEHAFNKKYEHIPWLNNEADFTRWCNGVTGYPIVDAGMRELNQTGYMHNRVRMITASFLTKHLLIDWRWGETYFAGKLLDYELASNNGGWQWAAGTGTDAQPWFRIFNPYFQAEKFDSENAYIKSWVPEYNSSAYVKPIVDHRKARERALAAYNRAVL